jgi:hypothetical protein
MTNPGPAGQLVKTYLEALARGDAQAALAAGQDPPGSTQFLTDDILKQQIAHWPITGIAILSDDTSSPDAPSNSLGRGLVRATARFGDQVADNFWEVKKDNGSWRLQSAGVKVSPQESAAVNNTLMMFGKPFPGEAYVFPGWIDLASSNPNLGIKFETHGVLPGMMELNSTTGTHVSIRVGLSDAGKKFVEDSVTAAFASCQSSTRLAPPPPCPVAIKNTDGSLVDGTAHWGAADVAQLRSTFFDPDKLEVSVMGAVRIPVTAQQRGGATTDANINQYVIGKADLTATPPTLTFVR